MGSNFGKRDSKGLRLLSREPEMFLQDTILAHHTAWNPFPKQTDTALTAIPRIKSHSIRKISLFLPVKQWQSEPSSEKNIGRKEYVYTN